MNIPKRPYDVCLPEKFSEWRPTQEEALEHNLNCNKRNILDCMPTGSGKTPYYVAVAMALGLRTVFVTSTKGLEDQLVDDFSEIGLKDVRGKANYKCGYRPDHTCEDGHSGRCPMKGTPSCPFTSAYNAARQSMLVSTNYSFWISIHKYGLGLGNFGMVVFDEAHKAPDELASSLQIRLSFHEINEMVGAEFPKNPEKTSNADWKIWANAVRPMAQKAMDAIKRRIAGSGAPKITWTRDYNHLRNLVRKLATISLMKPDDWIVDEEEWGFQFDPIRVGRYAERSLFLKIPRIMAVSATIRPKTGHILGMSNESMSFKEYASNFPPENSPIYQVPTMRVDYKHKDRSQLFVRTDQILNRRRDRKGIANTVSFDMRDQLYRVSPNSRQFITNYTGQETTASVVERYKRAEAPRTLVTPSVATGYDFPDDDCRYFIQFKIPFPDGRSKIIKARQEDDKDYGAYTAMQSIVQGCGRGSRHDEDWCEYFILDDNFSEWFLRRAGHMAPRSFHERYVQVNTIPPPMFGNVDL